MPMTRKEMLEKHKYKVIMLFTSIICLTCLNLCAEEMTTARAKEYRENLIKEAKKYIGCPYTYGATGPDEFDCSGLIYYVAREANGTQLPRTCKALYSKAKIVADTEKEPGDLLFFKTTDSGTISHVGIYIGNNQFISALSDGPNTGVILSSLKEAYWKPRYMGVGQIYKSGKITEEELTTEETELASLDSNKDETKEPKNFLDSLLVDASLFGDWSVLNSTSFMPNFRGIDFQLGTTLSDKKLKPGLSLAFRWNYWMGTFQMPITFSIYANDYIKFYMGPVITIGKSIVRDSQEQLSASIFPGVLGVSFITPSLTKGDVKFHFVQDIAYSVFNKTDNSALDFYKSLSNGLVFYSGIKIAVPASIFQGGK